MALRNPYPVDKMVEQDQLPVESESRQRQRQPPFAEDKCCYDKAREQGDNVAEHALKLRAVVEAHNQRCHGAENVKAVRRAEFYQYQQRQNKKDQQNSGVISLGGDGVMLRQPLEKSND